MSAGLVLAAAAVFVLAGFVSFAALSGLRAPAGIVGIGAMAFALYVLGWFGLPIYVAGACVGSLVAYQGQRDRNKP